MKTHLALLMLALANLLSAQEAPLAAPSFQWMNMAPSYRSLDEIKPTLVNRGKSSVYLSRFWPNGSAQLQRFDEASGEWEMGDWGITCGTVAQPTLPIEIKPNSQRHIRVYWQLSTDKWENPQHFVVFSSLEQRPIEGKYRFVLRYSLQPWTLVHHPFTIFYLFSPAFVLNVQ
jgi:hypothetical protein